MFPIKTDNQKLILLPFTSVWGWGTWKKKWQAYNSEMPDHKTILLNPWLSQRFNIGDSEHTSLFHHPDKPWDIRWYYSVFIRNGLFIFPAQTMAVNIGMDGSGTHYTGNGVIHQQEACNTPPEPVLLNTIDFKVYSLVTNYFRKENLPLHKRIKNKIRRLINF